MSGSSRDEPVQLAKKQLEQASSLYLTPGRQRDAVRVALVTIDTLLRTLGFETFHTKPLLNLVMALGDLDNGTVDPLLKPSETLQNRPTDPTSKWQVRAFLAAALEIRVLMGEKVEDAARLVRREANDLHLQYLGTKRDSAPSAARLIQLRKDFRREGGAGPRNGIHHHSWRIIVDAARAANTKPEPERLVELQQLYDSALVFARTGA